MKFNKKRDYNYIKNLAERDIKENAIAICKDREYPIQAIVVQLILYASSQTFCVT
jgi:hypothetical protein